jgi:predicted secreted acid phosphatase
LPRRTTTRRRRRAGSSADRHGRRAHAAHGRDHKRKLAIVLDIDETSLSNYSAILADNFTFGDQSRNEATDEIGVKIQPTLNIFNLAKSQGIAVFFITGRPEAQRAVTEENLHREGYDGWAGLSLKPPVPAGQTLTTVQYKSGERKNIEDQGYTIAANVGDQYSDLAGGAVRAFKLPNPFYFLP